MSISPLNSLRVVDLSRVLAGPLCTMMLGDLGAQVIKVERPGTGDDTRGWGPPFADDGQSAYFRSVNRNKHSAALDLTNANDQTLICQLAAHADEIWVDPLGGVAIRGPGGQTLYYAGLIEKLTPRSALIAP